MHTFILARGYDSYDSVDFTITLSANSMTITRVKQAVDANNLVADSFSKPLTRAFVRFALHKRIKRAFYFGEA